MKRISVKLAGSKIEPFTTQINPGDTAGDILSSLNLEGYVLPIPPSPIRYFAPDDEVYDKLMEGDFLLVLPKRLSTIDDLPKAREDLHQLLGIGDEEPMKRLQIRIVGSTALQTASVRPGTSARDVLKHLQLDEEYELAFASDPTNPFPEDADVHSLVREGERLIARLSVEANAETGSSG